MGIVHHSNYVRYLELGRIGFMDAHDRPYREYVAEDLHFATTHLEVSYHKPARYDDVLEIATWVQWVRGASIRIGYEIRRDGDLLVRAATNHGMVDGQGRPRRIPAPQRASLARAAGQR
jgi:acyl-CoA thioester hydrolase